MRTCRSAHLQKEVSCGGNAVVHKQAQGTDELFVLPLVVLASQEPEW